jgi:hypothetical protein
MADINKFLASEEETIRKAREQEGIALEDENIEAAIVAKELLISVEKASSVLGQARLVASWDLYGQYHLIGEYASYSFKSFIEMEILKEDMDREALFRAADICEHILSWARVHSPTVQVNGKNKLIDENYLLYTYGLEGKLRNAGGFFKTLESDSDKRKLIEGIVTLTQVGLRELMNQMRWGDITAAQGGDLVKKIVFFKRYSGENNLEIFANVTPEQMAALEIALSNMAEFEIAETGE